MAITLHHDIAVTASLKPLCSFGVAFCGVKLRSYHLGGESLEVGIDDERDRHLLVVVLKGELVLTLFWHLHPDSSLPNPSTVGGLWASSRSSLA